MSPFHPADFEHELHTIHVSQGRVPENGDILSFVAAYAHGIAYSYEYLQQYVERLNTRGSGYVENIRHAVSCPSRLGFLEALEFRLAEIDRCFIDHLARWNWPIEWGAEWGGNIASCLAADNGSFDATGKTFNHDIRLEKLTVHRDGTSQAIAVQKALLGHHQPITLDWYARTLLSRIIDVFLRDHQFAGFPATESLFAGLPRMIQIVWSYDLSQSLRRTVSNNDCRRYGIDGVLGDYYRPDGGREPLIRVHKRAIDLCAAELNLDASHLVNIVVVHELAHWLIHTWPHRGLANEGELTDWYEGTGVDVHEAWAQVLTYLTAHSDEGFLKTFNKLLPHLPPAYHLWKQVYDVCDKDTHRLMESLVRIRQRRKPVVLDEWLTMI